MRKDPVPGLPNDGSSTLDINAPERWPDFIRDQWQWNAEIIGVSPLADEHDYPVTETDVTTADTEGEPTVPARPHRIRHWFGHMFEELGKSYPSDVYYFF